MSKFKKGGAWLFIFTFIFLLHQDHFFIQWPEQTNFLGFPLWLWYFIGLHLALILAFYQFSQKYWKE